MAWSIEDFLGLAQAISSFISQAIETLIDCLFYPLQKFFYWLSAIADVIINAINGVFNSLWDIFDILYNFIADILTNILPYSILIIVLTGLTIMFLLKIYYFLRGNR